ncbi:MAG: phosphoribosylaminoimidazolesuccinocarboxamide synthase [Microbacterium sp.]
MLTSDSSRYWMPRRGPRGTTPAERMASFDKQIVRDWLAAPGRRWHPARAARFEIGAVPPTSTASCSSA